MVAQQLDMLTQMITQNRQALKLQKIVIVMILLLKICLTIKIRTM